MSAMFLVLEIQRHSAFSVFSQISPIRLATNVCNGFSEFIQVSTVLESVQKYLSSIFIYNLFSRVSASLHPRTLAKVFSFGIVTYFRGETLAFDAISATSKFPYFHLCSKLANNQQKSIPYYLRH